MDAMVLDAMEVGVENRKNTVNKAWCVYVGCHLCCTVVGSTSGIFDVSYFCVVNGLYHCSAIVKLVKKL